MNRKLAGCLAGSKVQHDACESKFIVQNDSKGFDCKIPLDDIEHCI